MGSVKGSMWNGVLDYIGQEFGPEAAGRVLKTMDVKDAALLSQKILPISWVDYGAYVRFLIKATEVLKGGDRVLLEECGAYNARRSVNGVFQAFLRILNPSTVLHKTAQLWRHSMSSGVMTVSAESDNRVELKVTDFPDMPAQHDVEQGAFIAEVARMTGIESVKCTHPRCLGRGDDHCLYVLTWK
ncbi:MAG: hypothetical protein AB1439_00490 [candidate division FCPU426 bacterium]